MGIVIYTKTLVGFENIRHFFSDVMTRCTVAQNSCQTMSHHAALLHFRDILYALECIVSPLCVKISELGMSTTISPMHELVPNVSSFPQLNQYYCTGLRPGLWLHATPYLWMTVHTRML